MEERMMMTSDITPVMGFTQLDSVLKKKKKKLFFHNFYFKYLLSVVSDSQFQTQNASPSIPAPPRHFLKMRIEVVVWGVCVLITQLCLTLLCHGLQPARLLHSWNSPGKNTGVGSHSLIQGIFPTQGSNPASCTISRFFTD